MNYSTEGGYEVATDTSLLWKMCIQLFAVQEDERRCSAESSARLQGPPGVHAYHAGPAAWCMQHGYLQVHQARREQGGHLLVAALLRKGSPDLVLHQ